MSQVLLDEVVHTDYGQFDLVWSEDAIGFDGDPDRYFDAQVNGLVGAASGDGVYINLPRRSGGSRVRVVLLDAEPPLPPPVFEDVVEVSIVIPGGATVLWLSWAGETSGELGGIAPGSYRLRVSARGRDGGREGELAESVVDEYLVELWPAADVREDAIVRVGSEDAKYWHSGWGGRR